MPVTKELINELGDEFAELSLRLHLKDEVLAGIVRHVGDQVISGLNILWFYSQTLESRAESARLQRELQEEGERIRQSNPSFVTHDSEPIVPTVGQAPEPTGDLSTDVDGDVELKAWLERSKSGQTNPNKQWIK